MFELSALSNEDLLQAFAGLIAQDRRTTAALLAYIAEIDARHLYLRDGHESMRAYCVARLGLSDDAAAKRIQVARLARQLPALFPALADGRLSLFSVRLIAPRLTPSNVHDLIAEAAGKSGAAIERMLACRFPQAEPLRLDDGITLRTPTQVVVNAPVAEVEHAARHAQNFPIVTRTRVAPISADVYSLEVSLPKSAHDKLREAQDLLGHAVPTGKIAAVIERALDALLAQLKKRKFRTTDAPKAPRAAANPRTIPAHVIRAVHRRDGNRCTWKENGRRCPNTKRLEFDHIVPVSRGGRSIASNLRTLCGAHNRAAAEEIFGLEFMMKHSRPRGLRD